MSRSVYDYTINKPDDFIQFVSTDFFSKEGFHLISYKGEQVWKRGTGLLAAPSYIKLQYGNGIIHIEAWIRYMGEQNLEGFVGALVKNQHQSRVNTLVNLLNQPVAVPNAVQQPVGAAMGGGYSQGPGLSGAPAQPELSMPSQQPIPVAVHNPTGKATLALVLGIISILMIWIPIVGVVCGGIGVGAGRSGRLSTKKGMATAGLVLSIIGLVLSGLSWLANIILLMPVY